MILNSVCCRVLLGSTALVAITLIASDAFAQSTGGKGGNGNGLNQGGAGGGFGTVGTVGDSAGSGYKGGGGGGGAGAAGGTGGPGGPGTPSTGGTAGTNGNSGTPQGGIGGVGGNGSYVGGGGGGGGNGLRFTAGGVQTVINATGGTGGAGGTPLFTNPGPGGGGGSGGYGIGATGGSLNLTTFGTITGGNGGTGGNGAGASNAGGTNGSGGDGGGGIYFGSAGSILNVGSGSVTGGNGAEPGVGGFAPGVAGRGGNGVDFAGSGNNVVSTTAGTTIQGGNGGSGAVGGAGIRGSGIAVTNIGTISGGYSNQNAPGAVQADAITFTGGSNSLIPSDGASFGTINGGIGITGTLTIDPGTSSASGAIIGNVIHDVTTAGSVIKSGVGALILNGTNTYTGGTTLAAGKLNVGSAGALGTTGALSFTGGTLQYSASNQTDYSSRFATIAGQQFNVDTNAQNVTWASDITSSGGSLNKTGLGTLTLAGNNSFAGGTTIKTGTLNLGSADALGSTGTIAFGSPSDSGVLQYSANNQTDYSSRIATTSNQRIRIDTNGQDVSFATGLSGTSSLLTKIGAGTLTLTGNNAIRLSISAGAVALNGSGSIAGDLFFSTPGGLSSVFDISQTTSGTTIGGLSQLGNVGGTVKLGSKTLTINGLGLSGGFGGVIEGTGGVTLTSANATLRLLSTNAYTGATTIEGGFLEIASDNAIAASSELNLAGSGASVDTSTNSATIKTLRGVSGTQVTLGGGLVITAGSTSFAGQIMDGQGVGSLTVSGGHQTLDGTNTYTGATTVNGGTLSVNGSISSSSMTTVNAGGTLGGNGTIGNTIINGGTLAPGNSIGTLTVQGSLALTAASTYLVEVSPTSADRVNVTGAATLGGASVTASFATAPGAYVSKQYTILNATGGRVGTFGALVNTNLPSNITSALSYDANNAYLDLTLHFVPPPTPAGPTPPLYTPLNANQQAVGSALVNYFNSNGGIPLVFAMLTPTGLSQVAGETGVGSQQTTFNAMTQFMGMLGDTSLDGRDAGFGAPPVPFADETMAYAAKRRPSDALAAIYRKAPPMAPAFVPSWSIWAAGFGGAQTTDGNAAVGSATSTSRIYGTAVGADYRLSPNTIAGFALAGGGSNFSVAGGGTGRSDLFQAGAFLRHMMGPAYVSAALAYGWQDVTTERAVGADRLQGRFNANAFSGRLEGGYRFATPWMGLTPYAAAQVTTFNLPNYGETAITGVNTFALSYASKTATSTRSELGLRTDKSFAVNDAILTLRGRAAWAHDYNTDRSVAATFQALPGTSFTVNGAAPARDAALTTASAEMSFVGGLLLAATFESEFSDVTRSYAGKGVVRYAW
jgi:autotransporter-associated beta strand protein